MRDTVSQEVAMMRIPRCGRRIVAFALGVLLAGGLASDAVAANREHQQLMADLRMLQEQTQQLQVTLNALTEVLKAVNTRIDEQGNVTRKALADQKLLIDTLTGDVRVVREKLDDANVRISSVSQEIEAMRTTLTTLQTAPLPLPPTDASGLPLDPSQPPATAPAPPPSTAGLSPQRMYDSAYADYASGQWSLAILGFEQYIKAFPRTELADDAQFTIGESFLMDGKEEEAIAAYDQVIANYPTGDAVPMAHYKRGLALERLKRVDAAREAYQTVVQKYPTSDAINLAKQALERLSRPAR
jgi:tol-pal system protein YbgF